MSKRIFLLTVALLALLLFSVPAPAATEQSVMVIRYQGTINPVVAEFIDNRVTAANEQKVTLFLLELDTPGGLDSSMRRIIQALLASKVPTAVYVAPSGARAASAGALITLAADFAAMAPGTNIGAAHPVSIGPAPGGTDEPKGENVSLQKVLNDALAYVRSLAEQRGRNPEVAEAMVKESLSLAAGEALEKGIIDLLAEDETRLFKALNGRSYQRGEETLQLNLADPRLLVQEMAWHQKILNLLGNPNIAYMLLMLGVLGIFFEVSQPGVILPGAIGALALLLALFAFQVLPINFAGLLLILLGLVLLVLEIKVVSFGMLTIGGVIAMTLGSMMLIGSDDPALQLSPLVIGMTVGSVCGLMLIALWLVSKAQKRAFRGGREGLVGEKGDVVTALTPRGRVFVHGEYWDARAEQPAEVGALIEVLAVEDQMLLLVRVRPNTTNETRMEDKS